jgi:large subunit ribosomal protein L24
MHFKTGDKVVVISGKDKGKEGTITKVLRSENRVVVEGVNVVKKHVKGNGQQAGSITEMEAPIHASNVMILDPKTKKPTRIGHSINKDGKKIRVTKKSNSSLN